MNIPFVLSAIDARIKDMRVDAALDSMGHRSASLSAAAFQRKYRSAMRQTVRIPEIKALMRERHDLAVKLAA